MRINWMIKGIDKPERKNVIKIFIHINKEFQLISLGSNNAIIHIGVI